MGADIKSVLHGLERMRSIEVDRDSHHYIALSHLNTWIATCAAPAASGVMLDYGCGGQPYKAFFQPYITRYIGADVAAASGVVLDIELDVDGRVPLPDGSIDTILSSQVLEHVFDFKSYRLSCARLLRPSGRLIISVPMQWRHHEIPFDYWRFTRYGLEKSLDSAGFRVLDLHPCGGVYSLLGQVYLDHLSVRGKPTTLLTRVINRFALWLDKRDMDADDTLGWMCVAEKNDCGITREAN
ncbi:methyltransferase domain-containing protein [Methyloglobulus sp.]|uniref:methyltransferase domain-containing protein n=1 Tax=Methyloglobulus sp. TaxID=2518622 RepID=UPI003989F1C2